MLKWNVAPNLTPDRAKNAEGRSLDGQRRELRRKLTRFLLRVFALLGKQWRPDWITLNRREPSQNVDQLGRRTPNPDRISDRLRSISRV